MLIKSASLGMAALLLAGSLALPPSHPPAAASVAITVTTTADELVDDGFCSLREAILSANDDLASGPQPGECVAGSGEDVINVPAGTYTLTLQNSNEPDTGLLGDLDVTSSMHILGAGALTTAIDGAGLSRVMEITGTIAVWIEAITFQNGDESYGAGILVQAGSDLTLSDSRLVHNDALDGGGLVNLGTATLAASQVLWNHADLSSGGISNSGSLTLTDGLVQGNAAGGHFVSACGGISNGGTLLILGSTITENAASLVGGGICNGGVVTMSQSTIESNTAGSGGGLENSGVVSVSASTIDNNGASGNLGGGGGGVRNSGWLTLVNDTISGNWASGVLGGLGGGVYNTDGVLVMNNVTVVNNRTDNDEQSGQGAGLLVAGGAVIVTNSLLAQNRNQVNPDIFSDCAGSLAYAAYDLIQAFSECTLAATGPGNLLGQVPFVLPLTDNGGPTLTHALAPGSPAFDAGSATLPESGGWSCAATDQRGAPRPAYERCDLGAFEYDGPLFQIFVPLLRDGF
jgi:CSLREA domain-containing protein